MASPVRIPPAGIPLEDIERLALIEALKMSNWVQKDAAELLAVSPRVMNYKIKVMGIELPRGRRAAHRSRRKPPRTVACSPLPLYREDSRFARGWAFRYTSSNCAAFTCV